MPTDRLLDELLRSLRVGGVFLIRETYAAPWAVSVPAARELAELLDFGTDVRIAAFHYVEFGACEIRKKGAQTRRLGAGEMAICFGGDEHTLAGGAKVRPEPLGRLLEARPRREGSSVGPRDCGLLCGAFFLNPGVLNPLVSALPALATVASSGADNRKLRDILGLLESEISGDRGGLVAERLIEILCLEVIRGCVRHDPLPGPGWCMGMRDTIVARALQLIHSAPERAWTVEQLARGVNLSPSRFAARFAATMGTSPISYLTEWRMHVAAQVLLSEALTIDEAAFRVGYENTAAFSRAFKKHVGLSPAHWRARQLAVHTSAKYR